MAAPPAVSTSHRKRPAWVSAIYEYLETRQDRAAPLRLVAEHAMARVPPGPAWREGQAKRKTDAKYRRSAPEDIRELERLRVIRNGSKRIVLKAIYSERMARRLERFERGGRPWLRVAAPNDE